MRFNRLLSCDSTYTRTHTLICILPYTDTNVYKFIYACWLIWEWIITVYFQTVESEENQHTYMHTRERVRTLYLIDVRTRTRVRIYTHSQMYQSKVRMNTFWQPHSHCHTYVYTNTYILTHLYIHKHTHKYTHT